MMTDLPAEPQTPPQPDGSGFLGVLVHEMRNRVAPISNVVRLLRLSVGSDPKLGPLLDMIERQVAGITQALDAASDAERASCAVIEVETQDAGIAVAMAGSATEKRHASPDACARAASSGHRILVADDSAAVRDSLAMLLRGLGHDVQVAQDGEQAVGIAQRWQPDFVLLDIHMPKLNGFMVARTLRASFAPAQMKLVMMSGNNLDEATLAGAKAAGFDTCVDKVFAYAELERLLDPR